MRTGALLEGGPDVSAVGLGCNNFGLNPWGQYLSYERCESVVHAALDAGYTLFDTADVYGAGESEAFLGRALGSRRDDVLIATKFGYPMPDAPSVTPGTHQYVRWAIEGSLRRLRTDHVDLFQIHRVDEQVPIDETLGFLQQLVDEGKVRLVGVSGFSADQLVEAASAGRRHGAAQIVSCMMHYSLITRAPEDELIPVCIARGLAALPYFPLESGLLTGKYSRGCTPAGARLTDEAADITEATWGLIEQLRTFAHERDISLIELAIGGLAAMPAVGPVIAGATKPEQVRQNARAADWLPVPGDLEALRRLCAAA
jgi:aryl-alcohol dehydrogenase-like predicted oxidoreductase